MQERLSVRELIDKVRSADDGVRIEAAVEAKNAPPAAVPALGKAMADNDPNVARTAKRALWSLINAQAGPGGPQRRAVGQRLLGLLGDGNPLEVRREALWMASEICDTRQAVQPVARLLDHDELKEDARLVLERLPGREAVGALRAGFVRADRDFKYALAASLRKRGARVDGYPCQKLLPLRMK
jgi:HEAT repeat protein